MLRIWLMIITSFTVAAQMKNEDVTDCVMEKCVQECEIRLPDQQRLKVKVYTSQVDLKLEDSTDKKIEDASWSIKDARTKPPKFEFYRNSQFVSYHFQKKLLAFLFNETSSDLMEANTNLEDGRYQIWIWVDFTHSFISYARSCKTLCPKYEETNWSIKENTELFLKGVNDTGHVQLEIVGFQNKFSYSKIASFFVDIRQEAKWKHINVSLERTSKNRTITMKDGDRIIHKSTFHSHALFQLHSISPTLWTTDCVLSENPMKNSINKESEKTQSHSIGRTNLYMLEEKCLSRPLAISLGFDVMKFWKINT